MPVLTPEQKELRAKSPAELADLVGHGKATIAAINDQLDLVKAEAIRRGLTEFDSAIFHTTLSPPSVSHRIDTKLLLQVFGEPFVDHFSKESATDWSMRSYARPPRATAAAAD